jgi:hypothetical protein
MGIRRSRYKLKDNIKLDIIEDGYTVLEWIELLPDWAYWQFSVYTIKNSEFYKSSQLTN